MTPAGKLWNIHNANGEEWKPEQNNKTLPSDSKYQLRAFEIKSDQITKSQMTNYECNQWNADCWIWQIARVEKTQKQILKTTLENMAIVSVKKCSQSRKILKWWSCTRTLRIAFNHQMDFGNMKTRLHFSMYGKSGKNQWNLLRHIYQNMIKHRRRYFELTIYSRKQRPIFVRFRSPQHLEVIGAEPLGLQDPVKAPHALVLLAVDVLGALRRSLGYLTKMAVGSVMYPKNLHLARGEEGGGGGAFLFSGCVYM